MSGELETPKQVLILLVKQNFCHWSVITLPWHKAAPSLQTYVFIHTTALHSFTCCMSAVRVIKCHSQYPLKSSFTFLKILSRTWTHNRSENPVSELHSHAPVVKEETSEMNLTWWAQRGDSSDGCLRWKVEVDGTDQDVDGIDQTSNCFHAFKIVSFCAIMSCQCDWSSCLKAGKGLHKEKWSL